MEPQEDFSALRNLLALRRLEVPMDTEVNRFLIEFHRRQRAQLLQPKSRWAQAMAWIAERAEGFRLVPSLSYASGFAALVLMAFLGFSQEAQVKPGDGQYKLSLNMPSSEASLAMVPVSFTRESSSRADALNFNPAAPKTGATRFVLANNRVAYDATAAF